MKLSKTVVIAVVVLLVVGTGYGIYIQKTDKTFGGGWYPSGTVIIGSASNLQPVPRQLSFTNTTSTDGGNTTIQQRIDTTRADTVLLNIQAVGGTATSTLIVRQMGSHDGTTYYDLATSTAQVAGMNPGQGLRVSSSTVISQTASGFQFVPGTATTTGISIPMQVTGYRYTRFLLYTPEVTTDPDDGIQAYITAVKVDQITR